MHSQAAKVKYPLASLVLLNDPTFVEAAHAFAKRILSEGGTKVDKRLQYAFYRAVSRKPDRHELHTLNDFIEKEGGQDSEDAWFQLARVLLNLSEAYTSSINMDYTNINRRTFLAGSGFGLGQAALAGLLNADSAGVSSSGYLLPKARAKRVIFLCMSGGPSHLETFDYKPKLDEMNGKPMPESFTKGQPIAQLQNQNLKVQGHLTKFKQYGQGGQHISDFLPWHAKMADDLCILRSLRTEQINHDPAHTFMNTGTAINGRPSMGAWVNYGLGSETKDLPGFVVLTSVGGRNPQPIASRQWGAGFLPSRHQGVEFSSSGDPVHYVGSPSGTSIDSQRRVVNTVSMLDRHSNRSLQDPEVSTRIAAYEMAFRMQASVPELMDISKEPKHVLDMYGAKPGDGSYASNCLLARRLAERGVRFIHLYHRGWDHHGGLVKYMNTCCGLTDKPTWALIQDLKQRGL